MYLQTTETRSQPGAVTRTENVVERRPIMFFDIDDCLYPKSLGMEKYINELVDKFLMKHLSLSAADAARLNLQYFKEHSLTVIGLQRLHDIDPMFYNGEVDNALPLDELLSTNYDLQAILEKFDRTKVKLWLFTNAYITHGMRVVKLLGVEKYFEGITFCDYTTGDWLSKPQPAMFEKAEREAGAVAPEQCFFVDDSPRNCKAAFERGWQVVRIADPEVAQEPTSETPVYAEIRSLADLHNAFPQLSK